MDQDVEEAFAKISKQLGAITDLVVGSDTRLEGVSGGLDNVKEGIEGCLDEVQALRREITQGFVALNGVVATQGNLLLNTHNGHTHPHMHDEESGRVTVDPAA